MTGEMFLAYLEQCLCPTPRRTVTSSSLTTAECTSVPAFARSSKRLERRFRYLPKYSSDLNPIEMAYSKFKEFLRSVEARTVVEIWRAIRSFLPSLSAQECANYLRHAGCVSI
jgi:putative transposase